LGTNKQKAAVISFALTSRLHLTRNPVTALKRSFIIIIIYYLKYHSKIRFSLIHALALSIGKDNINNENNMTPKKSKTSNVLSSWVKPLSECEGPFKSLACIKDFLFRGFDYALLG
jgi:hypothetical protein